MATPPEFSDFPDAGIVWRKWNAETEAELAKRARPILLFVADPDPMVFPFLRAIFQAMPANTRLRDLLHVEFPALYVEAGAIPEAFAAFGAGRQYHIAVLSPYGLNPPGRVRSRAGQCRRGRCRYCRRARPAAAGVALRRSLPAAA